MKMVLVVRTDLGMSRGKMCSQCGHAAVGAYERAIRKNNSYLSQWSQTGQAKVALKVESEEGILQLHLSARHRGLNTFIVADAGRTQIEAGSITVLAIGPGPKPLIDEVTGHLRLL